MSLVRRGATRQRPIADPEVPLLDVVREYAWVRICRDVTGADENHNYLAEDLHQITLSVHKGQSAMSKFNCQPGVIMAFHDIAGSVGKSCLLRLQRSNVVFTMVLFTFRSLAAIRSNSCTVPCFAQASAPFARTRESLDLSQLNLNTDTVGSIYLGWSHPEPEQTAIVRFLDHADRRIRRYIRAKQKLIALLEEQKQAIVQQAVTGHRPMSALASPTRPTSPPASSGWGRYRFIGKRRGINSALGVSSTGATPSTEGRETSEYGQVRFLKAENITSGEISDKPLLYIDEDTNNLLRRSQLQEGDVLFVIAGATLGKTALVREELLPANTNQAVAFIRPHKRLDSIYLAYWLQSPRVKELTWLNAVQSAQPNLSMTNLGNFLIPFSPFPEQAVIVSYLDRATAAVDIVIRRTRYQIDHLSEYRTRLIADVVTGKLDVREAAATLPEVDPMAAEDNLDDTFDTDAGSALDELYADLEEAEA